MSSNTPQSHDLAWHSLDVDQVARKLQSDAARGLSRDEAARRLEQYGPNSLAQSKGRSALTIFIAQFRSLMVLLLGAATVIAFAMGEHVEGLAVLVVILLNAAIGFFTEWKAELTLSALQRQIVPLAHVVRDGAEHQIAATDLVPGDLIVLLAGARVPADGRVIESARLQIEEAALTGESVSSSKKVEVIGDPHAPLGDRFNMAFMGTTISDGRGKLLVTATGAQTEVGKIGRLIDEAGNRETPLEIKLAKLGRLLIVIVLALCGVIVLAGWYRGVSDFWHMLTLGISLAIAAVPEGLPAVATMTLALGMQRMAKLGALVRRLPAVETLGSTSIICTDKTGTLTKNEMTVRAIVLPDVRIELTGSGYDAEGEFQRNGKPFAPLNDERLMLALRIGLLCNDAKVDRDDGAPVVLGDPTEAALVVAAEKAGLHADELQQQFPRVSEVPFDSDAKRMVTVHRTAEGKTVAFVKGSPGALLTASVSQVSGAALDESARRKWLDMNESLAKDALRVLGLAYRELPESYSDEDLHRELTFVGLVGMIDPLRDEAKAAIATCRAAGIRAVMITGDQEATAAEIAKQLGIDIDPKGDRLRIVHARELTNLDEAGWDRITGKAAVFARVSPEHKLRIVESLQRQGHVVAMTGDGVNDAPALKKADIGIAMGIKGTEVAKETAAMIITDDDFSTIVDAVEQGRIIYANILRFIHYLFSCNLSEILTVFIALIAGWPSPLAALQILWLNLITDVFPALALALEPSAPGMMKHPPRDANESLLTPRFLGLIAWQGALLSLAALTVFYLAIRAYGETGEGLQHATTLSFMTLALGQVFHAFNARSQRRSAFHRMFTNPWLWAAVICCVALQLCAIYVPFLRTVLKTTPMNVADWALVAAAALGPIAVVEVVKAVQRKWSTN